MKPYDNLIKTVQNTSGEEVKSALLGLVSSVQSGQILEDPNTLIAAVLLGTAGIILVILLSMLFMRRGGRSFEFSNLYTLETRLHTLEVTIQEQKNLIAGLKSQQKADFRYMKEELKNLEGTVADISNISFDSAPTVGFVANS